MVRAFQQLLVRHLPPRAVYALAEWRHGSQEPELRRLADFVPSGRVAVDIGAWLGPWTRALARRATEVHAFEPQPGLACHLRSVVGANVTVHEQAVGERSEHRQLHVEARPGRDALAHLAADGGHPTEVEVAVRVEVVRLADLDLGDVGFIKIDAEGGELAVLRGAEPLLMRCRPNLLVEVEQRHLDTPMSEVFGWLTDRGWAGWFLRGGGWRPLADFDVSRDQLPWVDDLPHHRYVNNFLFLPSGSALPRRGRHAGG
jgi:FkbM family methyltransferase